MKIPHVHDSLRSFALLTMLGAALACTDGDSAMPTRAEVQAHLDGGRIDEAVEALGQLVRENPDDFDLQLAYGRALISSGSLSRAIFPLNRAMDSPDHAVEAGLVLSALQLQIQDSAEAIVTADRVLDLDPNNIGALRLRAEGLLQEKQEEAALEQIDEVLETNPENIDLHLVRFRAFLALDKIDEAVGVLSKIREIASDEERGDPDTAAHFCVGSAVFAKERGQLEEAESLFAECLEATPDAARNPVLVREAAAFYDERGNTERATEIWQRAFELGPSDLGARARYAFRLRALDRRDDAEALLREATGDYPNAWLALVDMHVEDEDFEKAIDAMQGAIAGHPEPSANWIFSLADFQIIVGDLAAAESTLERLETPIHRLFIEGRLLYARGLYEDAYQKFLEAVRLWPDNPSYRYMAGLAADRANRYDAAIDQYKEAARTDPPPLEATLAFAELMVAKGEFGAGFYALQRLLKANPKNPQVLIALARANARSKEGDQGQTALTMLSRIPGQAALAVEETLRLADWIGGPDGALEAAASSNLDLTAPRNFVPLATLARILAANGRIEPALERTSAAVAAHPDAAKALALHAEILASAGQIAAALRSTERARSASPVDFEVLLSSTRVARAANDRDAAMHWGRAALEVEPSRSDALVEVALIEAESGRAAEALARLSKSLDDRPHDAQLAQAYAEILLASGNATPEALRAAGRRTLLFASDQAAQLLYGRILLETGSPQSAIDPLARAKARFGPQQARATYYLGRAEADANRSDDALLHLKEAIELGGFSELQDARDRLRALEMRAS